MNPRKMTRKKIIMIITAFSIALSCFGTSIKFLEGKVRYVKALRISQGSRYNFKITGLKKKQKKKLSYSSSSSRIAHVTKKGNLTASRVGKVKIIGKVGKKKYVTSVAVIPKATTVKKQIRFTNQVVSSGRDIKINANSAVDAYKQIGKAMANRYTRIEVHAPGFGTSINGAKMRESLFDPKANYVSDYDYLSYNACSYAISTNKLILTFTYRTSYSNEVALTNKIRSALSSMSGSGETKIKKIHDYIVNNTEYVSGGYSAYNALIDGGAVCQGYAMLFYKMCEMAGINCRVMTGTAYGSSGAGNHAWNYVNGKYIDVTWDDTTRSTNYYLSRSPLKNHYLDHRSSLIV